MSSIAGNNRSICDSDPDAIAAASVAADQTTQQGQPMLHAHAPHLDFTSLPVFVAAAANDEDASSVGFRRRRNMIQSQAIREQIAQLNSCKNAINNTLREFELTLQHVVVRCKDKWTLILSMNKFKDDARKLDADCESACRALDKELQKQEAAEKPVTDDADKDLKQQMHWANTLTAIARSMEDAMNKGRRRGEAIARARDPAEEDLQKFLQWMNKKNKKTTEADIQGAIIDNKPHLVLLHTYCFTEDLTTSGLVHYAVIHDATEQVLRALLAFPVMRAAAAATKDFGCTALAIAVDKNAGCAFTLMEHAEICATAGDVPNERTPRSVLMRAVRNEDMVKRLLTFPHVVVTAGVHNSYGDTALSAAIAGGHAASVKELLACDTVTAAVHAFPQTHLEGHTLLMQSLCDTRFLTDDMRMLMFTTLMDCPQIRATIKDKDVHGHTVRDRVDRILTHGRSDDRHHYEGVANVLQTIDAHH